MDMLRGGWGAGLLGNGAGVIPDSPSVGGYSSEAEAIFAAFTTPPTTGRKDLIDAAVVALKAAGVWAKLDALYAFAAADSQAALINWKQPGTYNGTLVNAPAFTADSGFTGGSTKYIDTGFIPSTAPSPKYVMNDASMAAWSLTAAAADVAIFGDRHATSVTLIFPRLTDNNFYTRFNRALSTTAGGGAVATAAGLSGASILSSSLTMFRNNADVGTAAYAPDTLPTVSLAALQGNATFWTGGCAAICFGAALDAAQRLALYNVLRTYLTGVGVP